MAVANLASDAATEILTPGSESEAIEAFGDGTDVVVVGGGTIVVPEMSYRRLSPAKALMLKGAALDGITKDGSRVTIGATTAIEELVDLPAPIGPCAANIADREIRGAATIGGNLCAGEGYEAPRGDLQGAFIAVGATVRSAGEGGIEEEPLEDFLPKRRGRLLLDISYDEPAAGAFAGLDRPHTHDYTALAVAGAKNADGTIRLAATGAGSHGQRLPSAERGDADAALDDVTPRDDALASAWYRAKVLPVLVRRVLTDLEGAS
jgi:aerobic carbon-monoxide dehydrogenase medium subunit